MLVTVHSTCSPGTERCPADTGLVRVDQAALHLCMGSVSVADLVDAGRVAPWAHHRGDTLGRDVVTRLRNDTKYKKRMRAEVGCGKLRLVHP